MKDACFHINFEDSVSAIQIQSNNAVRLLSLRSPKDCQFYLSANKGQPPLPLSKVASGGEISRTMLAQSVLSQEYTQLKLLFLMKLIRE